MMVYYRDEGFSFLFLQVPANGIQLFYLTIELRVSLFLEKNKVYVKDVDRFTATSQPHDKWRQGGGRQEDWSDYAE